MHTKVRRFWRAILLANPYGWREEQCPFTWSEVRRLLRENPPGARAEVVRRCMARPTEWLPPEPHFVRCPLRYQLQLTRIVFWYAHGESVIDRAIEEACGVSPYA